MLVYNMSRRIAYVVFSFPWLQQFMQSLTANNLKQNSTHVIDFESRVLSFKIFFGPCLHDKTACLVGWLCNEVVTGTEHTSRVDKCQHGTFVQIHFVCCLCSVTNCMARHHFNCAGVRPFPTA